MSLDGSKLNTKHGDFEDRLSASVCIKTKERGLSNSDPQSLTPN
jgi:hypothetical protein